MTSGETRVNDGVDLAFDCFGDARNPAVILVMGLGMPGVAWPMELIEGLTGAGYRVIRYDNRDVGHSTILRNTVRVRFPTLLLSARFGLPVTVPYDLGDMALDALGLLDALGIETAHVIGVSMGGMIAQHLAARFPWRIRSLTSIMSSSGARRLPGPSRAARKIMLRKPAKNAGREELLRFNLAIWKMLDGPTYPRDEQALHEFVGAILDRGAPAAGFLRQYAAIVADGSRVDLLTGIRRPALVIHGTADPLVPVQCGVDTARHIKDARLELFPGMGHSFPDSLLPHITDLIATHLRQAR